MRVSDHLENNHIPFETLVHPPAFSAQKRAKCLHVPGRQVAKGVLFVGSRGYYLAVLPATHHVDLVALSNGLNQLLRMADSEDIAQVFNDCEFGVVPPFGSLYGVKTVLDESIAPETTMVFEGHTHFETFRLTCRDYVELEKPIRLGFAQLAK